MLSAGEVWDNWSPDRNACIDRFDDLDVNNDGAITRNEWRDSVATFRELDRNRDNRLSRANSVSSATWPAPVAGTATTTGTGTIGPSRTRYMAGYERGWSEGHAAGREDRDRNQGWDLEGQRELETAIPATTRGSDRERSISKGTETVSAPHTARAGTAVSRRRHLGRLKLGIKK